MELVAGPVVSLGFIAGKTGKGMDDSEFLCENMSGPGSLTVTTGVQLSSVTDLGSSVVYPSTFVWVINDLYSVDQGSVDLSDDDVELRGARKVDSFDELVLCYGSDTAQCHTVGKFKIYGENKTAVSESHDREQVNSIDRRELAIVTWYTSWV